MLNNLDIVLKGQYKVFACKDCDKRYKHRQSLHTHKKTCQARIIRELQEALQQANQQAQTNIQNNTDNSINDHSIHTDASTTNIDASNHANNFNINLQPFGQEDMSHITHEQMSKVIKMRYEGLMEFARLLYQNEKNLNVFVPNVSRNTAMVFKPPNWESMREDSVTETLVQRGADMISDYMEANTEIINSTDHFMMDQALTKIQKNARENMKRRGDIRRVIEENSHRKRVWENYKEATDGDLIIPPVEFN